NGSTWSDDYVAVWNMEQSNPIDATRNGNDGIGQNVSVVPAFIANGIDFDGLLDDDIIDITQNYKLPIYNNGINDEFTIEGWVTGDDQVNQRFFAEGDPATPSSHWGLLTRGSRPDASRIFVRDDGGDVLLDPDTDLDLFDDFWRHWAFTRSNDGGNNRTFRHWVDGVQDTNVYPYVDDVLTPENTTIGALRRATVSSEVDATLDEIRISCVARSSNWLWATWRNIEVNDEFNCYLVSSAGSNGTVSGSVLIDENGDGNFDPEDINGIAGVTVVLTDTNGMPLATNITDLSGIYRFNNLPPGPYRLVQTDLPEFISTGDSDGPNDNMISVVALPGVNVRDNNFLDTDPGTLNGVVYLDINGDGVADPEDTNGIAGVTIVLSLTNGTPIATNLTDASGGYSFSNVPSGRYLLTETDPAGFISTEDADGGNDNTILI
ncbi:MAG: SdrD B-like domain-containing protein, partial [Verrucomicrobiota bacterium]